MIRLKPEDYIGKRYGKLVVTDLVYKQHGKRIRAFFICDCDCRQTKAIIASHVKTGHSSSCGCTQIKHGMSGTRIYNTWHDMIQRCENENDKHYADYGFRGITVCDEWNDSYKFIDWALSNGYSDDLTIDRINNDKGYSPDNCRWTTKTVQVRNRRIQKNNATGMNGIYWHKQTGKWQAMIGIGGRQKYLGCFTTFDAAVNSRRDAERELWKESQ